MSPDTKPKNQSPPPPMPSEQSSSKGEGFAVTSLVLGIIAFVFGWLGPINLFTSSLAVIFGGVGLRRGQSKVMSIIGLVLGLIGLLTSLVFTMILFFAANSNTTSP